MGSRAGAIIGAVAVFSGCTLVVNLDHLADGPPVAPDAGGDTSQPGALDGAGVDAPPPSPDAALDTLGLVGRWRLDETSGTIAADSSPSKNPGVLTNGPTWILGTPGGLLFDGEDDFVEIAGTMPYATQSAPFSFSAWFDLVDFALDQVPDIMQLRSDTNFPWHVLLSNDPGHLGISLGSADAWATIMTGVIPTLAVWHHIAVTYNGHAPDVIANFQIFLDGAAQTLLQSGGYGDQPQDSRIGGSSSGQNPFRGFLRDVRIYDRVLDPGEIAELSRP
jgi:hypothetical protein